MRFLLTLLCIFFLSLPGKSSDVDSIMATMDNARYGERFLDYTLGIKFLRGSIIRAKNDPKEWEKVLNYIKLYKGCTCDLYYDYYADDAKRINIRRRNWIQKELYKNIDSADIELRLYGSGHPGDFQPIFGTDKKSEIEFKKYAYLKINCLHSFHFKGEKAPFTGTYIDTYSSDAVHSLRSYIDGRLNGRSYYFDEQGKLIVTATFKEGKCISGIDLRKTSETE